MENKKVKTEVAIGIILLLALVIGGSFWMNSNKNRADIITKNNTATEVKNSEKKNDQKIDSQKSVTGQDNDGWWIHQDNAVGITFGYPSKLEVEETGYDSNGKFYGWKNGENAISTEKIEYDNNYVERAILYEPHQLSSESAKKLFNNTSCDELSKIIANFSYDDKYRTLLPSSFKRPNLCGYLKENGVIKFYVVGVINDAEGAPFMGSDIIMLTEKHAVLISDVLGYLGRSVPKAEQYEKAHPNIEFASDEDIALRKMYEQDRLSWIKNPDKELKQKFDLLSEIAKRVTIGK